jgi:hypothetical protein
MLTRAHTALTKLAAVEIAVSSISTGAPPFVEQVAINSAGSLGLRAASRRYFQRFAIPLDLDWSFLISVGVKPFRTYDGALCRIFEFEEVKIAVCACVGAGIERYDLDRFLLVLGKRQQLGELCAWPLDRRPAGAARPRRARPGSAGGCPRFV